MPCPVTHMYLAGRLALKYGSSSNDVLKDINSGFSYWLAANQQFKDKDSYKKKLRQQDSVAIFSAFATGAMGPDLWVLPHKKFEGGSITGMLHFDLGHYNLSHRFPMTVLKRLKDKGKSLPDLQRKYQTAYILGYLSHIALDITGHIMVNVTAGAYHQGKKIWENEQGFYRGNIWKPHNKIEHFADCFIKYLCFDGGNKDINKKFDKFRSAGFEEKWAFPHIVTWGLGTDFHGSILPAIFAERYESKDSKKRVVPFILEDYKKAYEIADTNIVNNKLSIT